MSVQCPNNKDHPQLPSDKESTTLLTYTGANLVKNDAAFAIKVVARLCAEVRKDDSMALLCVAPPGGDRTIEMDGLRDVWVNGGGV